ncbi:hypothetical protein WMY93_000458 [Mugilogobius chulae]|uniref:Uncharacterized protein n=1 Tax=Mugilogobius chulae TaxID=88201 RepID=A0AAW0Q2G5_9GOBI
MKDLCTHQTRPDNPERGIPKHFGVYYSMGFALIVEGVLSACYHVCPNYDNFQFAPCMSRRHGLGSCLRLTSEGKGQGSEGVYTVKQGSLYPLHYDKNTSSKTFHIILTLDDDLDNVDRNKIHVF